ncbi:MAG: hypothetical protein AB1531_10845 [Chloroflexota bacterium]
MGTSRQSISGAWVFVAETGCSVVSPAVASAVVGVSLPDGFSDGSDVPTADVDSPGDDSVETSFSGPQATSKIMLEITRIRVFQPKDRIGLVSFSEMGWRAVFSCSGFSYLVTVFENRQILPTG